MRIGAARHGDGSALVLQAVLRFVLDRRAGLFFAHVGGEAAALNHKTVHDAMEDGAIIMAFLGILQEVVNSTWSKENRLNELKTELAAADRKIQLSITPESKDQGDAKKIADELKNIQEKAPLRLRTM